VKPRYLNISCWVALSNTYRSSSYFIQYHVVGIRTYFPDLLLINACLLVWWSKGGAWRGNGHSSSNSNNGNQLPKAVGRILNPKRVASSIRNALNCVLVLSAGPDRIKIIARLCSGCLCPGTQVILIVEFIHGWFVFHLRCISHRPFLKHLLVDVLPIQSKRRFLFWCSLPGNCNTNY
jgi:hypothetical protein